MNLTSQASTALDEGLLKIHDIDIPAGIRSQLLSYIDLLMKWNRVYNLTAVRDPCAMVKRHLLDSLVLLRWLPSQSINPDRLPPAEHAVDVVDIGSGAGLPVLPLAIARPDLSFVSIESNGKKTRFQQQVLVELALANVQVQHCRVQDASLQGAFITSRAFTAPESFLKIAKPLCSANAQVAIMLGHADRLPQPLPVPYKLEQLEPVDIPGAAGARHIALCRHCEW